MGSPQIRPDVSAGSARVSGNGTIIWVAGIVTSVNRTGLGTYEIGLSPNVDPNEHTFTVTPILGFPALADGSVNLAGVALIVQTTVGGVTADLDFLLDIRRTRTSDGSVLPSPAAIPAVPPPINGEPVDSENNILANQVFD